MGRVSYRAEQEVIDGDAIARSLASKKQLSDRAEGAGRKDSAAQDMLKRQRADIDIELGRLPAEIAEARSAFQAEEQDVGLEQSDELVKELLSVARDLDLSESAELLQRWDYLWKVLRGKRHGQSHQQIELVTRRLRGLVPAFPMRGGFEKTARAWLRSSMQEAAE